MHLLKYICAASSAAFLAGCASFSLSQTSSFVDEDGNVITVEYGTRSKKHKFEMVSPVNGQPIEIASVLMVRVTLPDGERITAYQCFNPIPRGTMYMTEDEHWKYLASGFSCTLYEQIPDKSDYLAVFDGILAKGGEHN